MSLVIDTINVEGLVQKKQTQTQLTTTTTSASVLALDVNSTQIQIFTGSVASQVVKMPDATTLIAGYEYEIVNEASVNISIQDSASGALFLLGANERARIVLRSTSTAAGTWYFTTQPKFASGNTQFTVTYPGSGVVVNYTGGNARFNGTFTAVAAGSVTLPVSTTGILYVDIDATVKATVSLPDNAVPLFTFTTSATSVTALNDVREDIDQNLIWGASNDIQPIRFNSIQGSGVLEKYARADHQHEMVGLLQKSGSIAAASFTGSPRTAAVAFTVAFPSANYSVSVIGQDGRTWKISGKSASGFTINSQAAAALTGPVDWYAALNGESK